MSESKKTREDIVAKIATDKIRFLDLQFADLPGRMQHTTICAKRFSQEDIEEGVPKLDGSSIRGFVEINESDLVLKPDPSTFAMVPWMPDHLKTARMICDVYLGFGQGRLNWDPRAIAQRAEQAAKNSGYELSYWGPEVEFFVFDAVHLDNAEPFRSSGYRVESKEAVWNSPGINFPIRFKEGYFPAPPQDTLSEYRSECVTILEDTFGIECDAHHHEVATAGQVEIDLRYSTLVKTADNVMTYKYVAKNVARSRNSIATFMPKPIFMDNASGMHVHVSLWNGTKNLFYDSSDPHSELSQLARYFAGGLMEHGRAISCIVSPTTNSYRRLVPGYEAPVYIGWSRSNRSATVRVPVYKKGSEASKRIEYRPPDPSANPYLCFAAMLAAGLDGIKKKIDPGDPVDENIYKLTAQRRRQLGIKELPGSLAEAVECLKSDSGFLEPIFGSTALEKICENALKEDQEVNMRPHPHEFQLYLDI